ncbi:glutathione S-transferase family protein (plasmid) [Agrobacterium tumefaciens]|uniref:glutathione S-transferase family protein n=1 Tax=Agrobacterium tumefaciens TaxID=358 RepID=UPI0015735142|nr:glutathione S-transferase family protein [Agrobacterium tumefaciens]NSZ66585.1 glutathione S-transferase family protein [Agrobacterium tumefaciens]NTA72957.1 glutathione S-transferase family protein [Agrobacterium tumefaciens]WIE41505.1 glutathione S-transferase family protein [Agrobacterium tumefaciens]
MITLYDSKLSGNAWKVRLLLRHLNIPFKRVTMNLAEGTHKSADFEKLSRFQRVPVVGLPDGTHLSESGAILLHFSEGTDLLPQDPKGRAAVTAWLFYEQADLGRFLAYPRFYAMTGQTDAQAEVISHYHGIVAAALAPVERTLGEHQWLHDHGLSAADFALYPYIRLSPEGGFDLSTWPNVQAWIARFEALPAYEALVAGAQQ